ncbi:PadR family transcriptional regulator [Mesobacillus selenatarsenatis]|uniref:Transcriptional regulator, PadR family n=1 Tax=Mesobacillus selenatarsenatis (strain DSM 18680 / JCM 14380 / FERM P-15431 / SF-1) TaxID=1321606 RepID=A0A0A8X0V9_MESS1|nr:PadR family transcriptional regulator [Mesobacillus selenatarsenatis]GAM13558.1 transcriptional regulator, PadR family [Mesobacillus selenatarsenatis SF-1]
MSIEHSILAVISFRPSTGYDIKAEFEHKAAGLFWGISYGSLYPKLKKLVEQGYISLIETDTEGRKKKLYELTGKGWIELESWLAKRPEPLSIKDELFIKIAAWHDEMDISLLAGHLRARAEESQEILNFVKGWKQNNTSYISSVGMLAMRYAELKLEAELLWIEESLASIKKESLPAGQDPKKLGEKQLARRKTALKADK